MSYLELHFLISKYILVYAAAKSLQSCLTLCNPINGSPPGSPIPVILQARTLEWVAISFSNEWKWKVKGKSLSHVWPLAWTAAYQAPPSMGFSTQEYWSGLPLPSPLASYSISFLGRVFTLRLEVGNWVSWVHILKNYLPATVLAVTVCLNQA